MRFMILAAVLLLSACGFHEYETTVRGPKPPQYTSDLTACKQAANHTSAGDVALGSFGLLGMAAGGAADSDYFKSKPELTDECMRNKGYDVAG